MIELAGPIDANIPGPANWKCDECSLVASTIRVEAAP
jgi:hypothetical protein